jgi:uncharacterized membrane protein
MMLTLHILAGGLALVSGFAALYSLKGAALHRQSGMVFVYAMIAMASLGGLIAATRGIAPRINIPAAMLAAYLVITSLITVRPLPAGSRWVDPLLMLVALTVGAASLTFAFTTRSSPVPFLMFGIVGLVAGVSDLRVMRSGPLRGAARLGRHLWRMCFALFIAALSFFIGQAKVFPKPVRILPLLALPVLAVLLTMLYWMWRVRRGSAGVKTLAFVK